LEPLPLFFDDYPLFAESAETAATTGRLNLRHRAMIEFNRDVLKGARVLDLASHDGRWSFAALKAGAAHVTGVEARRGLVRRANKKFKKYGVGRKEYTFVHGDLFEVLAHEDFDVDVVLCLGFMYHTLRYPELLHGIMGCRPDCCILDTKIILSNEPMVRLQPNLTTVKSNAAKDSLTTGSTVVAGWPSLPALHLLLETYGLEVEEQFDWAGLLAQHQESAGHVGDYNSGTRVTLRCRPHGRA
jgi:hypothetical protein